MLLFLVSFSMTKPAARQTVSMVSNTALSTFDEANCKLALIITDKPTIIVPVPTILLNGIQSSAAYALVARALFGFAERSAQLNGRFDLF